MAARVLSAAELEGSEVVGSPPAPAAPAGKVLSPAELAGSEVVDGEDKPAISRGKAAVATTLQGSTLGFADELGGVGGAIGELLHTVVNEGRLPSRDQLGRAYTESRDEQRQTVQQAREAYPYQSFATEVAGGLVVPLPGGGAAGAAKGTVQAAKAVGLGRRALLAAKALAPIAGAGAAAGVGYQEGAQGETASAADLAESAGTGAATSLAVTGALKGAGRVLRRIIPTRDAESIKQGIVDQLAQTEGGPQATPTAQKRVSKAADAILDEVTKGPDGGAVHEIIQAKSAKKGLEQLQPLLDQVESDKQAHYDRFARAGQHVLDVPQEVATRLKTAEQGFRRAGDSRMADGLAGVRDKLLEEAQLTADAGGATDLRWLRKHVTTLQDAAASKLGSLNEHERARVSRYIAGEAKDVLDEVIDSKAAGRADLAGAAGAIRRLNRRQYALLSVQDVLENRAEREAAKAGTPLASLGKKIAAHGSLAAAGAVLGGAPGAALGIAAPIVLRKADRWLNARAIDQLRAAATGQGPGPSAIIKSMATELQVPERQVRAAYLRLISSEERP